MFVRAFPSPRRTAERQLVQRPGVAERDVVARRGHALARRDAGRRATSCPCSCTQRVHVAKWISAIAWKFGPSARIRHAWSRRNVRLVGDERRDRDVVLGARRRRCGELRREPEPVGRGVEDRAERPASSAGADAGALAWRRAGSRAPASSPARVRRRARGSRRGGLRHAAGRRRRGDREGEQERQEDSLARTAVHRSGVL